MSVVGDERIGEQFQYPETGNKLILGTVQFGLNYGATNSFGMPSLDEVESILRLADASGIRHLDTARAYGESETRIARIARRWSNNQQADICDNAPFPFEIITKLDPLSDCDPDDPACIKKAASLSLGQSMEALDPLQPNCILLHRPEQREMANGAAWKVLQDWKAEDVTRRIGVSVSTPEELISALADSSVGHVQLPYNCLDHRWETAEIQNAIRNRPDVIVHVRSVLLQGLLGTSDRDVISQAVGKEAAQSIDGFMARAQLKTGASSRAEAAVALVAGLNWISGLVVGVTSARELKAIISALRLEVKEEVRVSLVRERPHLGENILNPALWTKRT